MTERIQTVVEGFSWKAAFFLLLDYLFLSQLIFFYGEHLSKKVFNLFSLDKKNLKTPAYELEDGVDYVPANKNILFGHHFSSIAGAAPIVGPAVAAIWGWVPAFLWIIFGVVFMGAAHDFGVLVLSMQNKEKSMSWCKIYWAQK